MWDAAPFAKLQAAPTDGKPVTQWPNQDAAFEDIARKIKAVAEVQTSGEWGSRHVAIIPARVVWNLPRRNRYFTGRETALTELSRKLPIDQIAPKQPVVITAADGTGKSELALEYAYRSQQRYDVVSWLRADTRANLLADTGGLASALHLGGNRVHEQEAAVAALQNWLEENRRWLLVFDSATQPNELEPFLPKQTQGDIVITSSTLTWDHLAVELPLNL
jgi:hypothetical protein